MMISDMTAETDAGAVIREGLPKNFCERTDTGAGSEYRIVDTK